MLRRQIYYSLKPYLPWGFRTVIRRMLASRSRQACKAIWPVHEAAGQRPAGWPGWPDGKQFAFVLTHDVEGPGGVAASPALADLEVAHGFRSSFNFVPEGTYPVPSALRRQLSDRGFEIGIHDLHHDGLLYHSRADFRKNAERINAYVKEWGAAGFRSGFMLHELDWLHDLDVEYDASTFDTDPFEPQPEAVGTIFPFWIPPPPDRPDRRGYVELPYTLPQDSTLFLILRETTPDIWIKKLDWVARHGGMALINVHPDYLQFSGQRRSPRTFPVEHYTALLRHVRDNYAGQYWQPLPRELARYVAEFKPRRQLRRPKRVCLVTYSFYERDSRVSRYGDALAQRGDEVEVLSLRSSPSMPRDEVVNGCRIVRLQERPLNEKSPWAFLFRLVRFLWQASWWLQASHSRRPYDIIHVHNVPDFLVFAAWRPKLGKAKIILDIHDIVPELFESKFGVAPHSFTVGMLKLMERASAAAADHVILANHLWLPVYTGRSGHPKKVSVLINYVDNGIFATRLRQRQDGRQIVLFPGSLQFHQGLDVAVRAFPRVVEQVPGAELHIYGDGPAKAGLITLAKELGLDGHVKFFGYVSTKEIAAIMAEADLGVVPKKADSFGNEAFSTKIFEFMSLGIPVVASSTKIDRYYFTDSVLRFFESGNSEALAENMIDLLRHPDIARQMASRASEYVAKNSWETRKVDYLAIVDRLCP